MMGRVRDEARRPIPPPGYEVGPAADGYGDPPPLGYMGREGSPG
jgi:hypothetical protein